MSWIGLMYIINSALPPRLYQIIWCLHFAKLMQPDTTVLEVKPQPTKLIINNHISDMLHAKCHLFWIPDTKRKFFQCFRSISSTIEEACLHRNPDNMMTKCEISKKLPHEFSPSNKDHCLICMKRSKSPSWQRCVQHHPRTHTVSGRKKVHPSCRPSSACLHTFTHSELITGR